MDQAAQVGVEGGPDRSRAVSHEPPAGREGLAIVLDHWVPSCGAVAAALLRGDPPQLQRAWNCAASAVGKGFELVPQREGAWPEGGLSGPFEVDPVRVTGDRAARTARVLGLNPAGPGPAWLALFFESADEASHPRVAASGAELATLVTLLLDREFYVEEARRARHAREHFLVALHHELRTPATALTLESGLLQSGLLGNLPPRLQTTLARLDGRVTELVRVVERVLDLAQLETGAEPERVDLLDPRQEIVTLGRHVEPAAERRGNTLALFFPRTLPLIQTDGDRFRRVLLYLLANAVKYTRHGRIQLRVERGERTGDHGRRVPLLVVRVVDTGCGVPAAELERIFEPFAQVDEGARTDSRQRGVGLGLSLARRLARSIGGDVEVESAVGQGTRATFTLPISRADPG